MKKLDHDGLLLSEYQAKLFEKSTELNCSTGIFIRRFLHSDWLVRLDENKPELLSLDVNEGISDILEQFGDSNYGKIKFSKNAMFWMGYMYRYISYTREAYTGFIMQLFPYKKMNDVYYAFHTQDPEWCVRNLLEMNSLSENVFDNNYRLKEVMSQKYRESEMVSAK